MRKTLLFIALSLIFSACNVADEKPEIAELFTKHFKDKLYNQFDTAAYKPIFLSRLKQRERSFLHPKLINTFYERNENLPILTTRFYVNGELDSLKAYLRGSREDGFNAEIFDYNRYAKELALVHGNKFKTISQVYSAIADLELSAANALNKYTNFVEYGVVNPKELFNRYQIPVKRPNMSKMDSILNTSNLALTLQQAQQTAKPYVLLKKALARYRDSLADEEHASIKAIKLNLERMRWSLPRETDEKVVVNIPDFTLTWFNKEDTLAHMKVCLGEKREATYQERMKTYLKSKLLADLPSNHETPQLFGAFSSIQVNPIWNIPVSIAQSEIYWLARKDRYYLSNNNIQVYRNGKLVANPDTIVWDKYPREKLPFRFKQGAGSGNALGKFKFIFDSSASIYLHDTNNKRGFSRTNRAISHGCVRIEDPLKFAELMVGDKYQYDRLRMEVNLPPIDTTRNKIFAKKLAKRNDPENLFTLKPAWFGPRKNITLLTTYHTAWVGGNGNLQLRPDIYGYDPILWAAMKKYL